MNGLIKHSKLENVGHLGVLSIALFNVAAVFLVMATAFTGGGVA
jgi:hypothetical protein